MDIADYITKARKTFGIPANDRMFDDSTMTDLIEQAAHEFFGERDWTWLDAKWSFDTTTTNAYPFPGDLSVIRAVNLAGRPCAYVAAYDIDRSSVVELPTIYGYSTEEQELVFTPTPAAGQPVIVRYTRRYVPSNISVVPEQHSIALVYLICKKMAERASDARVATFTADYTKQLGVSERMDRRNQGPNRVRVRPGGVL